MRMAPNLKLLDHRLLNLKRVVLEHLPTSHLLREYNVSSEH